MKKELLPIVSGADPPLTSVLSLSLSLSVAVSRLLSSGRVIPCREEREQGRS